MMNDTVARIVDLMFEDTEMNEEVAALRDEVMNNCQDRYADMITAGMAEDDAVAAVVESLKGMEDVIAQYGRKRHAYQETADEACDEAVTGERVVTFEAAEHIDRIDLCLVSEDVRVEPSADDDFHVCWNADDTPQVQAYVQAGVIKIERSPDEREHTASKHFDASFKDEFQNMVRHDHGKLEIDMNGLDRAMKSLGDSLKRMFAKVSDGNVRIRFGSGEGDVTIQVPRHAAPRVKLLTTSGDMEVQDVVLAELNATSTSGDIHVDLNGEQLLQRMNLRTTSGDIDVSAYAQEMTVGSTSGDVEVAGNISVLALNTISGDIDVRADVRSITFKAISGDVDMAFDSNGIREVHGSTISGDIDIDLPNGIGTIAINTQTRSGDVTTRYSTNGVGPMVAGSVTSMSGDITIR